MVARLSPSEIPIILFMHQAQHHTPKSVIIWSNISFYRSIHVINVLFSMVWIVGKVSWSMVQLFNFKWELRRGCGGEGGGFES